MIRYKKRHIEQKVLELFSYFPVVAVLGARQVGKSTLVTHLFQREIETIVFDPVQDVANARQDPDFFLQNVKTPAFLDEIQYAPELLASIKRKVDREGANGQYVISGSQNLSVLRNISESLAGRVAIVHLATMSRRELGEEKPGDFMPSWLSGQDITTVQQSGGKPEPIYPLLWRGGYPKLMELPDHLIPEYFQSYLQTYIERDVRTVANIGSLQSFGRFIGLLAAHSAQEVNHNQLGRELGIDRKTAVAWTEIAEATYQWRSIPAFARNPVKKIAGKRKGFFTDTGLLCYLQKISSSQVIGSHPLQGAIFESFVAMELLKNLQQFPVQPNIYHFRSYSGAEVDIILELDGVLFPIEIKTKSNPTRKDIRGFAALRDCFPGEKIHKGLLICSVDKPFWISESVYAIPWWIL